MFPVVFLALGRLEHFLPCRGFELGSIGTFWFEKWEKIFWTISSIHVLKDFLIYILRQNVSKIQIGEILNYITSSCTIFCSKMPQYFQIVYYWRALKTLLSKIWFLLHFSHLLHSFLSVLRFLNLLSQAKSLIRLIALKSSSSKLLSRLILLRFIVRMPFHYKKMWHYQNLHQKRINHHLRKKQYKVF